MNHRNLIFRKIKRRIKHIRIALFKNKSIFGLIYFCFILVSCDCWTEGSGIVIDSITKIPLDSVVAKSYIKEVADKRYRSEMLTDSTGKFDGSTGNTGRCVDLVIELTKSGYYTRTITNPENDTIQLIKK